MTTTAGYKATSGSASKSSPVLAPEEDGEITSQEIMDMFGEFPDHVDFVRMVQDAQVMAMETKKRVPYSWKGYKSCVFPNLSKFKLKDLEERLCLALKGVFSITAKEKQVISYYYDLIFFLNYLLYSSSVTQFFDAASNKNPGGFLFKKTCGGKGSSNEKNQ